MVRLESYDEARKRSRSKDSAAGIYIGNMMERLGIAEEMRLPLRY
jgi:hypothetical protein